MLTMETQADFERTLEKIKANEQEGKVVFMTAFGMMSLPIDRLCRQCADGLLYDLNRDEATTLTLGKNGDERWINDYAVAKVIRYLMEELDKVRKRKNNG